MFIALILVLSTLSIAIAADTWTNIAPGIEHLHRSTTNANGDPLNIHVLKVDLSNPAVAVGVILAGDETNTGQYETTSSMAMRKGTIAAVNGDYFGWGHGAEGFTVVEGRLVQLNDTRSSLVISTSKVAVISSYSGLERWMFNAIGGGPKFINNGLVYWSRSDSSHINGEWFPNTASWDSRHPLTAIGITADGRRLILAVVDGRQPGFSVGMTPWEMGALLVEMGAATGIRLDGGGSSTFFLDGRVLNSPSDGYERAVADAFAVYALPQQLGLAACWKLDESSGTTAFDSSGYQHPGTLFGNLLWQPGDGRQDGALRFRPDTDYIEVIDYEGITGKQSRTVAAWIKAASEAYGSILSWGADTTGGRWLFFIDSASGAPGVSVADGLIVGNSDVTDQTWHHVAAVFEDDGGPNVSDVRLYVDGLRQVPSQVSSQPVNTTRGDNVKIGPFAGGPIRLFYVMLDEVVIFDTPLTDRQIVRLYNQGGQSFLQPCGSVFLNEEILLDGDINRDCKVDSFDLVFLANDWLQNGPTLSGDLHTDSAVNLFDLSIFSSDWLKTVAPNLLTYRR